MVIQGLFIREINIAPQLRACWQRSSSTRAPQCLCLTALALALPLQLHIVGVFYVLQQQPHAAACCYTCDALSPHCCVSFPFRFGSWRWLFDALALFGLTTAFLFACLIAALLFVFVSYTHTRCVCVCVRRHLRSIASGGPLSDFVIALRLLLFSISSSLSSSSVFLAFAAMSGMLLSLSLSL